MKACDDDDDLKVLIYIYVFHLCEHGFIPTLTFSLLLSLAYIYLHLLHHTNY